MNLTILDGKHQENGFTSELINAFIKGIKEGNNEVQIAHYELIKTEYSHCLGCGQCMGEQVLSRGNCAIKDKATEIISEALEADIVVFATPIYEYCVSSTMKKFLERCLPLAKFGIGIVPRIKPIKGKAGVILLSSGAPFPFNHLMGITWYPGFMLGKVAKFFGCEKIYKIYGGGMGAGAGIRDRYLNKAYNLGKKINKNLTSK